tara:strand:+ start:386 stop:1315 length:930 start_codon:yes stop_codon:yes gene_type:complete
MRRKIFINKVSTKKIIFIGNVIMSLHFLKTLVNLKKHVSIKGIISRPKNSFNTDYADLKKFSKKNKIPFCQTLNINSKTTYSWIKKIGPDYIFCFGFSQLIKNPLLRDYKNKIIGFHPSSFPILKGRNPIVWSIILNRKFSGTNFFFINKRPDSGGIIDHYKILIKKSMNANDLYNAISKAGQKRIPILIKKILKNKIVTIKNTSKILMRKRKPGEEIIDWRMSNKSIHNLVRALSKPYIGAYFFYKKDKYRVLKTSLIKNYSYPELNEYGKVLKIKKKGFVIKCGEGVIEILETYPKIRLKLNESIYQ